MERRNDLDFAKGVGIILMVLGHCFSGDNGTAIRIWIYSFHMPLFFVIAGMLRRSRETLPPLSVLLKKRGKGLLLPYFVWGSLAAVYLAVMGRHPLDWMLEMLRGVLTLEGVSAMWFLPCLFLAELLFHGCLRAGQRHSLLGHGAAAVLAAAGLWFPPVRGLAAVVLRSMTGASFLYLGWFLAELLSRPCKNRVWAAGGAVQVCLGLCNGQVNLFDRAYGNGVLFYLNALLGTWAVIRLYRVLVQLRCRSLADAIGWFGKNSLILVCTSVYAIDLLRLADYKLLGGLLPTLGNGEGLVLCALAMGLESIAIFLCGRYLWFTFGKKNPKQIRAA